MEVPTGNFIFVFIPIDVPLEYILILQSFLTIVIKYHVFIVKTDVLTIFVKTYVPFTVKIFIYKFNTPATQFKYHKLLPFKVPGNDQLFPIINCAFKFVKYNQNSIVRLQVPNAKSALPPPPIFT
jgi:hypothetical protein